MLAATRRLNTLWPRGEETSLSSPINSRYDLFDFFFFCFFFCRRSWALGFLSGWDRPAGRPCPQGAGTGHAQQPQDADAQQDPSERRGQTPTSEPVPGPTRWDFTQEMSGSRQMNVAVLNLAFQCYRWSSQSAQTRTAHEETQTGHMRSYVPHRSNLILLVFFKCYIVTFAINCCQLICWKNVYIKYKRSVSWVL